MLHIFTKNDGLIRKSTSEISYTDVLSIGNWEDLRSEIIRREVGEWVQVGYGNWMNKLRKENILPSFKIPPNDWNQIEELMATRNVLVHNRGRIDDEYLRRSKHWYGMKGIPEPSVDTVRAIDTRYYMDAAECLKRCLQLIDHEVLAQYPS